MKVICVCDICNTPITIRKSLRGLELIKETSSGVRSLVWDYELCMKCAVSIEQDIIRKKKLNDARREQNERT